jgi:hypothetical protein
MSTQCHGKTLKGKQCTIRSNSDYCRFHKAQEGTKVEEIETCCVCTDPIDKKLKCGHGIHIECVIKSGKKQCPLCRAPVRMKKEQTLLTKKCIRLRTLRSAPHPTLT